MPSPPSSPTTPGQHDLGPDQRHPWVEIDYYDCGSPDAASDDQWVEIDLGDCSSPDPVSEPRPILKQEPVPARDLAAERSYGPEHDPQYYLMSRFPYNTWIYGDDGQVVAIPESADNGSMFCVIADAYRPYDLMINASESSQADVDALWRNYQRGDDRPVSDDIDHLAVLNCFCDEFFRIDDDDAQWDQYGGTARERDFKAPELDEGFVPDAGDEVATWIGQDWSYDDDDDDDVQCSEYYSLWGCDLQQIPDLIRTGEISNMELPLFQSDDTNGTSWPWTCSAPEMETPEEAETDPETTDPVQEEATFVVDELSTSLSEEIAEDDVDGKLSLV